MEGAARDGRVVMGVDGRRLVRPRRVDRAARRDRRARGTGAVVQAGETVEVDADDLVVRRVDGRLGVIAAARAR